MMQSYAPFGYPGAAAMADQPPPLPPTLARSEDTLRGWQMEEAHHAQTKNSLAKSKQNAMTLAEKLAESEEKNRALEQSLQKTLASYRAVLEDRSRLKEALTVSEANCAELDEELTAAVREVELLMMARADRTVSMVDQYDQMQRESRHIRMQNASLKRHQRVGLASAFGDN